MTPFLVILIKFWFSISLFVNLIGYLILPKCNLYSSFDTEVGDGEFPVYEIRDGDGKLRCIVIGIE